MASRKLLTSAVLLLSISGCAVTQKPVTQNEAADRAQQDLAAMFTDQEQVSQPIDLYEAMARALKYNYDYRLSLMEQAVSNQQLDVEKYNLLPKLMVDAGYSKRDNILASYSDSLENPGTVEVNNSVSQERERAVGDTRLVWNVLDFGVSYMRAKQQSNNALITEERRRKVVQNIVQEVRDAYWRTVAAERVMTRLQQVSEHIQGSLKTSENMRTRGLNDPLVTLGYSRDLLQTLGDIERRKTDLALARSDLARLMNIKPGTAFTLVADQEVLPQLHGESLPAMQLAALSNRPELKEQDYTARIVALQGKIDKFSLMPNLTLDLSMQYDSNKYLYHQGWGQAGANLSLDIIKLASYGDVKKLGGLREQVTDTQRKATTMAVLTQVEIAERSYAMAKRNYCIAGKLSKVQGDRVQQYAAQHNTQAINEMAVVQSEADALLADVDQHFQYAALQSANGLLLNSIGIDPVPSAVHSYDISGLKQELKSYFEKDLEATVGQLLQQVNGHLEQTPQPLDQYSTDFCQ